MSSSHAYNDLFKLAKIDTIAPHVSDLDIEEAFHNYEESNLDDVSLLSHIQQRSLLFFGPYSSIPSTYQACTER